MRPYLLHQAVEQAACRYPERVAVVGRDGEDALTYAGLEEQSRGLALWLRAQGLTPGARVGIWMRKSTAAVVGLVAVLRAGGVYVPFDPGAPAARVRSLAADCGLRLLLADGDLLQNDWTASDADAPDLAVVPLEAIAVHGPGRMPLASAGATSPRQVEWSEAVATGGAWRPAERVSLDLAYILYTSGSTGVPKGVMLSHEHALNFIEWVADEVGLGPEDRVASHAPFHFDLSIFDVFASLSRGAQVCLLDAVTARFPAAVAEWVRRHQMTVWYSVPSALVQLLPRLQAAGERPPLRVVMFAGEVFPAASLRAWREWLPGAEFYNLYGPTETNVCTWYRLPQRAEEIPDPLPIGVACPNFALEILDAGHRPVAAGKQGYLWARGPGLLTGYWGNAQRTEASVLLREGPGGVTERLYNTGDVVSTAPDGLLRFHGRRDDQVKCRGYRVSLLEVQETLLACPGVRQAAVVALPDAQDGTRLFGFVAPAVAELNLGEVLAFCRRRLPAYMIPDQIEIRLKLPETSTGKVDRPRLLRELQERARGNAA